MANTDFVSQMIETLKPEGWAFLEETAKNAFNEINKAYADKNWVALHDWSGILYAATHHLKRLERWEREILEYLYGVKGDES